MFTAELKSTPQEDISILIRVDNHAGYYLCECGEASALTVKECQRIRAIFISHTHIDHFINFDQILRHQIGIKKTVVIVGPPQIAQQVQAKVKAFTWNLIAPEAITYEIREIIDEQTFQVYTLTPPHWDLKQIVDIQEGIIYNNDVFKVTYTLLDHKIPSVAYLFKAYNQVSINLKQAPFKGGAWVGDLKKAYERNEPKQFIEIEGETYQADTLFHLLEEKVGDSLGVIMDHAAHPANHQKIIQHFENCKTVFIECFYKEEDRAQAITNFHSYLSASASVMKAAKVTEAIPVHFSRRYAPSEVEQLVSDFMALFRQERHA
ncbi:MAG: peptidase [Thermonemataceae bacterium]